MSNVSNENSLEIDSFEKKLRQILCELQFKTETLEKSQEHLFEAENRNAQLQILVDNEKRMSRQLMQEMQTAVEVIGRLEDEKIRGQTEKARLEINWDTSQAERIFLIEQAKKLKLENMELKRRNEMLETKVREENLGNKKLERRTNDLRHQVTALQSVMKSNLDKLKLEQEQLFNSFQALGEINSKIENVSQVILTNTQKDKKMIQELTEKLMVMEMLQVPVDPLPNSPIIEAGLTELSEKFKLNRDIDEKLTEICKKMSSTYLAQTQINQIP